MTKLRITIFGNSTELLVGTFPKDGADWILEYCKEFKPYTDIEEVWYGEGLIPKDWTNGKDWHDFDNVFHEYGFTFEDKDEIKDFLSHDLEQPAIEGIYTNDKRIKYDLSKSICHYRNIDLPHLNENEVFVYHGEVNKVSIDYLIDINKHFVENNVNLHFIDCGNYGYILKKIDYDGEQMTRVYSSSKIQVKSSWLDHSQEDLLQVFSLTNSRGFLQVKFKKERG